MADALDLGSSGETRAGSSPVSCIFQEWSAGVLSRTPQLHYSNTPFLPISSLRTTARSNACRERGV